MQDKRGEPLTWVETWRKMGKTSLHRTMAGDDLDNKVSFLSGASSGLKANIKGQIIEGILKHLQCAICTDVDPQMKK